MNASWDGMLPITGDVIIVQGEEIIRAVMSEIFTNTGARVYTFPDADTALRHLITAERACALVIADHGLPGKIQGAEFINKVHEQWPKIFAILISGYILDSARFPAGSAFLKKPWSKDELLSTAALLLEPSSTARRI